MLDLDDPRKWPAPLIETMDRTSDIFRAWDRSDGSVSGAAFDRAYGQVWEALQPYSLRGWHCSRLTDEEVYLIIGEGMHLPDGTTLRDRIDRLVISGRLTEDIASMLRDENESDARGRAGMLHFTFYPPHLAGEGGIERFFRHWGGEALYNSHEDNPVTSAALRTIGVPCVVEADVPIASLGKSGSTSSNIIERYQASHGARRQPGGLEDRIYRPLPPNSIMGVHRFPGPEFAKLTGCDHWDEPVIV